MAPAPDHPLRWLADQVERRPDAPALLCEDISISHGLLWDSLGRWSRVMRSAGLAPGQPTAVQTRSRSRLARAIWLAVHSGLPLLTLNPSQIQPARLMRQCGVRQVIADADVPVPGGVRRLPAATLDRLTGGASPDDPTPMRGDRPQLLVPTSGTEGPARAVMLSCRNISSAAFATNRILGLEREHRWLCALPLTHVAGIMILMRCAAAGAATILHEKFDARNVAATMAETGITHVSLVPAMLHRLLEAGANPSTLRAALLGGSGVSDDLAERALAAAWPVKVAYGLTETTAHVALGDLSASDQRLVAQPGTRIEITRQQDGNTSEAGFIQVSGPTVMLGYANEELEPGDGLVRPGCFATQDLGKLEDGGRLRVLGRSDDVLISGGVNVHPAQVEDLLAACPGVAEIAVTGVSDPVWGTRLIALYRGDATEEKVYAWAAENIAGPLRPREVYRVRALPRTALGKLRRRDLPRLLRSRSGNGDPTS